MAALPPKQPQDISNHLPGGDAAVQFRQEGAAWFARFHSAAAAAAAAVVVVVAAAAAVVVIVVVVVVLFSFIASNCLARHTVDRLSAAGFQQRKPQRTTKKTTWAFKSICYGNLSMQNVITDDEEQYCCEITLFW